MRRRYLRNRARGNIIYPGLIAAWSAKGKTNDDADRAILKDLTGNGHDITLNGFAFSEMSGYGGYTVKKTVWDTTNRCEEFIINGFTFIFKNIIENNNLCFTASKSFSTEGNKIRVKITGIPKGGKVNLGNPTYIIANEDGIYESIFTKDTNGNTTISSIDCIGSTITIEFLPEYPDALVFDGVNDYGVNRSTPSLSDYTIIVKKKALNNKGVVCATIGNFGEVAFVINDEFNRADGMVFANSFSSETSVKWVDNISYQTKNSYNGETISVGKIVTTHGFSISMYGEKYWKGAFYSAYLFDRSLDEQEIKAFIRKYIDANYVLPSEQTT